MRTMLAGSLLLVACLVIPACGRRQVHFELQPGVASSCKQPIATRVVWDAAPLGVTQVQIWVNNLGRPPQLWLAGGGSGAHTTGAWARDGYTVTLKSIDGRMLARRTLTTTPCPGKDWL
jgi:hypothetical protein